MNNSETDASTPTHAPTAPSPESEPSLSGNPVAPEQATELPVEEPTDPNTAEENDERLPAEPEPGDVRLDDPDAPGNWIVDPSTAPVEPNEPA